METTRRNVLQALAAIGVTGPLALHLTEQALAAQNARTVISIDNIKNAATIRGENFNDDRLRVIHAALQRNLDQFQVVRDLDIDDLVEPAPIFNPLRYDNHAPPPPPKRRSPTDRTPLAHVPTATVPSRDREGAGLYKEIPMATNEIVFKPAYELAALIKAKKLSPVEVTTAFLDRAEALNPKTNAFITITREHALVRAKEAETEIQHGHYKGPLHGIPYAPKDICATKGIRTTNGSKVTADWVPDYESTVTERMNDAGAILLGKLNLLEFAMGSGVVSGFGPARNPWGAEGTQLAYAPAGSSSGSGVALAAYMTPLSIGTDTGGSIRGLKLQQLRHRRPQANLRARQPFRRLHSRLDPRPRRPHDQNRPRRRRHAPGSRRPRSKGRHCRPRSGPRLFRRPSPAASKASASASPPTISTTASTRNPMPLSKLPWRS